MRLCSTDQNAIVGLLLLCAGSLPPRVQLLCDIVVHFVSGCC